jgi:hypothetical protein
LLYGIPILLAISSSKVHSFGSKVTFSTLLAIVSFCVAAKEN